jgi:hypothetical protein
MEDTKSFGPLYKPLVNSNIGTQVGECYASVTVAASNGAAVASTVFPGNLDNNFTQIQIANKTSVWVHVNFGVLSGAGTTVRAATLTDMPVPPGASLVYTVHAQVNAASVFADGAPSASTSVMFTRGQGV